jgi:hypothetical protein
VPTAAKRRCLPVPPADCYHVVMTHKLVPMMVALSLLASCASRPQEDKDSDAAPTAAASQALKLSCSDLRVDQRGTLRGKLFVENTSDQDIRVLDLCFAISLQDMHPVPPIEGLPERPLDIDPYVLPHDEPS